LAALMELLIMPVHRPKPKISKNRLYFKTLEAL
jgi:hypothetical protein